MVKKRIDFQEVSAVPEPIAAEEASTTNLRADLEEIRTYDGVMGYILRNSNSAAIELKDPTRIIDFAIISSSAIDVGEKLSKFFDLGKVKGIVIEGENLKVFSLTVGANEISIFFEKDSDFEKISRKLR